MQFKYRPFKDALLRSWRAAGFSRLAGTEEDSVTLWSILVETAQACSGVDLSVWIASCGHRVWDTGPAPVLSRLGILQPCCSGAIVVGPSAYVLVSERVQGSRSRCARFVRACGQASVCTTKAALPLQATTQNRRSRPADLGKLCFSRAQGCRRIRRLRDQVDSPMC